LKYIPEQKSNPLHPEKPTSAFFAGMADLQMSGHCREYTDIEGSNNIVTFLVEGKQLQETMDQEQGPVLC
jgi:hypothetical protein